MASASKAGFTENEDSDDEKLSSFKRKREGSCSENAKKSRFGDSDDDVLLPQVLVKVEVEEIDETYQTDINNLPTLKKSVVWNHFSLPNSEKKVKCRLCSLELAHDTQNGTGNLVRHMKRKHPTVPLQRPVPNDDKDIEEDGDSTSKTKRRNATGTKKKKEFACTECDAVYDRAGKLRNHAEGHRLQTRHKCDHCGRCFKKAFSLRLHQRSHAETEQKCPLCDQTYAMKVHLGRHLKTNHEKKEECTQCDAKFYTREQLEQHNNKTHPSTVNDAVTPETQKMNQSDTEEPHTSTKFIKIEIESDTEFNSGYEEIQNPYFNHFDGFLKRENLTHPTQCAIVNKLHKGRSVADICKLYKLTPDVVNKIWEDREKYDLPKRAGKRTMKYMNGIVDKQIVDWFNTQRANDVQVSGKMLQDAAESIAKDCGFVAFNGTKKWLDRFKQRYNISLRGTPSNRDYHNLAAESKWKKMFFKEQWCDVRFGVADDDIYTADEVGLFYNPSKGRIKKFGGRKFIQGHIKDRLSIFMCTNSTGTDKRKLVVCGTEDPLIRSYRNPDTLPVTYIRHNQAHFTTQIFEQYVKYWNAELQLQDRKAILVIDRATIHSKLQLSNLQLVFVPWKASSGLMPIKSGIFTRFRQEFRKLFLEEKAMNCIRGVDRNFTCLEALNMLEKAWERLPRDVIFKGFENTGYDIKPIDNVTDNIPKSNDDDILLSTMKHYDVETYFTDLQNLDMYLTVDEEYLTGQGTNGSVFGGNHKIVQAVKEDKCDDILPLATEKPDNIENEAVVKRSRALEDLEIVRKYLHSNDTSYEIYRCFLDVENCFVSNTFNSDC